MNIDASGWLDEARHVPSPNRDSRPAGAGISLLVIHNISLPPGVFSGDDVIRLFTNALDIANYPFFRAQGVARLRVSAHFLIRRDGTLVQFVSCNDRAWHAGKSQWRDVVNVNPVSIGIKLEGTDDRPFDPAQYQTLAAMTRALLGHYPIGDIVGHRDVAPGRKTDPGPCFDWDGYRRLVGTAWPKRALK